MLSHPRRTTAHVPGMHVAAGAAPADAVAVGAVAAGAITAGADATGAVTADAAAVQTPQYRRCTECRKIFLAAASARATQRVCGVACRGTRDRKLARARRLRAPDEARTDERERQRASRARRREASGCHAPPSSSKCPRFQGEVGRLVDRALAPSRATLVRDFEGILKRYVAKAGEPSRPVTPDPNFASS